MRGVTATVALAACGPAAPGRPPGASGARRPGHGPGAAGPPGRGGPPALSEAGRHPRVVAAGNPAAPAGSLPHRDCRSGQRPRPGQPTPTGRELAPRLAGAASGPESALSAALPAAAAQAIAILRPSISLSIMMALERGFALTERPGRLGTCQAGNEPRMLPLPVSTLASGKGHCSVCMMSDHDAHGTLNLKTAMASEATDAAKILTTAPEHKRAGAADVNVGFAG